MWIVQLALRRPYTFIVLGLLILIIGPLALMRTPTDIFPNINISVVSVAPGCRARKWKAASCRRSSARCRRR
jgi:multidrug efflux pump subunit AcrB